MAAKYKPGSILYDVAKSLSSLHGWTSLAPMTKQVVPSQGERLPPVCNLEDLEKTKPLLLRTKQQTSSKEIVQLKQFDPYFFSHGDYIRCRFSDCKERHPRQKKADGPTPKEDLYLCPSHRSHVERKVKEMCRKKNFPVSTKNVDADDLKLYTSMIGVLESEYQALTTWFRPQIRDSKRRAILQEVCLNARNYLVIVNALMNPSTLNLSTVLPVPLSILQQIMFLVNNRKVILATLRELADLMRKVMEHILFAFGVIYSWIDPSLFGNFGAQLGTGIGGFLGMTGFALGPGTGAVTTAGGAVFGGLIGNALYKIGAGQQNNTHGESQRYQGYLQSYHRGNRARGDGIYQSRGDAGGNLAIFFIVLPPQ